MSSRVPEVSLAVIIPTRNRASLAINAIRSLLGQRGASLEVFVSDNSPEGDDQQQLASFSRRENDPRLTYLRPSGSLHMAAHWDWAVQEAMSRSAATHFMVHYDRKVTKPDAVRMLSRVASQHPGRLLTFGIDWTVADPVMLVQSTWTGKVYEVRTSRVLELTAEGEVRKMGGAFPLLSNCVVPRSVLENVKDRFGDICNSTGPDSCFTYRFCALLDDYLHYDVASGILYAAARSNGLGYLRGSGDTGGDFSDFLSSWGDRPWLDAAPIPQANLGQNMLYHEYVLVRNGGFSDRLPPLQMEGYLRDLGRGLLWIENPDVKQRLRALLEEHGWSESQADLQDEASSAVFADKTFVAPVPPKEPLLRRLTASRIAKSLAYRFGLRMKRWPRIFLYARFLGVKPDSLAGIQFSSDREALRFAIAFPRAAEAGNPYLAPLNPREVSAPDGD